MPYIWDGVVDEFTNAFLTSFAMIIFSEIGDKTFLITAIMSMKHARLLIFASSILSLSLMTFISVGMGMFLFHFVPVFYTKILSSVLFCLFGFIMIIEGIRMEKEATHNELQEVCEEIESSRLHMIDVSPATVSIDIISSHALEDKNIPPLADGSPSSIHSRHSTNSTVRLMHENPSRNLINEDLEHNISSSQSPLVPTLPRPKTFSDHIRAFGLMMLSPVFIQVFIMIFVAVWGDRSQFSTIALAASKVQSYLLILIF